MNLLHMINAKSLSKKYRKVKRLEANWHFHKMNITNKGTPASDLFRFR